MSYTPGEFAVIEASYIVAVEAARLALEGVDVQIAFLPPE